MSQNIVRANIVLTLFNIFQQGRYATIQELNTLKAQMGVDGGTFGAEIEAMAAENLLVQNADGTFGLTQNGLNLAQSLAAAQQAPQPAPQPVAQTPAPVPQAAAPAPQPVAQTGGAKGGGKKGGKKGQTAAQPAAQNEGGFKYKYKLMSELSLAELQQKIETWTLYAEANLAQGQPEVCDGLMRSVSRAKRRLRNLTKGLPATPADE